MRDFNPDWLFPCTCGDRTAFGVVHRKDEPCYRPEEQFVADFYGVDVETAREVHNEEIEAYMRLVDRKAHRKQYELAKVKFNNGYGALLCNECSIIIAEGWEHEDRAHLCKECKESKYEDNSINR